jgi:predicted alpha/beta hydrolase family esterase
MPGARRIRLHDWNCADWVKWRNSIIASLISIDEPVVLIAQGYGALAAASVAAEYPGKVLAALLIDPADADAFDIRKKLPKQSLPQPARIVMGGSSFTAENHAKAAFLALSWGADFSPTPHNSDELWPEAVDELRELVAKAQHNQTIKMRNRKSPRREQRFQLKLTTALAL